jgi:hypothetical protein
MKPVHVDVNSKTRHSSKEGLAGPKSQENLKEAEGIIKGDSKKAGEAVIQQNKTSPENHPRNN